MANPKTTLLEDRFVHQAQQLINRRPPYYGQTPDALLKSTRVKPKARLLFGLLHSHAAVKNLKENCVAKVGLETLAEEMGLDVKNVRRWMRHLAEEGWITIIRRGRRQVNWYRLWPMSRRTFDAMVAHQRVQYRLKTDGELCRRLSASLYPDRAKSPGHTPMDFCNRPEESEKVGYGDRAKSPSILNK